MNAMNAMNPPEGAPQLTTATSLNWLAGGILYSQNTGKEMIDLKEAQTISRAFEELSPQPVPLLVDLGSPKGQTKEARDFFSSAPEHLARYSAVALLITNPIAKILANFYLGLNKPQRPTRLFTDVPAAETWLRTFLDS